MPRAATKADLIQASNEQFAKLRTLIDGMTDKEKVPISFRMNAIKTCATFWFTCTNGTVFCWIGYGQIQKENPPPFCLSPIIGEPIPQWTSDFGKSTGKRHIPPPRACWKRHTKRLWRLSKRFPTKNFFPKALSIGRARRRSAVTAFRQHRAITIGRSSA